MKKNSQFNQEILIFKKGWASRLTKLYLFSFHLQLRLEQRENETVEKKYETSRLASITHYGLFWSFLRNDWILSTCILGDHLWDVTFGWSSTEIEEILTLEILIKSKSRIRNCLLLLPESTEQQITDYTNSTFLLLLHDLYEERVAAN